MVARGESTHLPKLKIGLTIGDAVIMSYNFTKEVKYIKFFDKESGRTIKLIIYTQFRQL